jgi:rubrerythrin
MTTRRATRRDLLRGAAAAGAAASALGRSAAAVAAPAATPGDDRMLAKALRTEQLVVIGYQAALATDAVSAGVRYVLEHMLAQELQHVGALERILRSRGAPVPGGPASTQAAQEELTRHHIHISLTGLRTQHLCLRLLINLESLAEGAYFAAISKLHDPSLVRTSLEIMGCEAQHWTLLSSIQHHGKVELAVPYPFVQGSS